MNTFAIVGTFDVANLGDVIFPMIAENALSQRLPGSSVRPYSYHASSQVNWPYEVSELQDLDEDMPHLDGLLIGGGHLIRFEKEIAPGYEPKSHDIAHPGGYWLAPAIAAAFLGVPTVWNAPSASSELVNWGAPLWTTAARAAGYIAVRDTVTRSILTAADPTLDIHVVPDSAYGAPELWTLERLRDRLSSIRTADRPYVLLQDCEDLVGVSAGDIAAVEESGYDLVRVPISPVLGDGDIERDLGYSFNPWPDIEAIVSLIAGASLVVGRSLHMSILATSYGVPVLRPPSAFVAKYAVLRDDPMVDVFSSSRLLRALENGGTGGFHVADGTSQQSKRQDDLCHHWDRIAEEFTDPSTCLPAATLANLLIMQTERLTATQLDAWPAPPSNILEEAEPDDDGNPSGFDLEND